MRVLGGSWWFLVPGGHEKPVLQASHKLILHQVICLFSPVWDLRSRRKKHKKDAQQKQQDDWLIKNNIYIYDIYIYNKYIYNKYI